MCGIAGFIDLKKQTSQIILEKMTNTLEHRGPDGFGYKIINNDIAQIGFGHRRLSIIDLSETGKQPMTLNEFTLTFNGEIYNYLEIKSELEALNHKFIGNSDTEMILHAYQEWGKECIHRFIGMFAFAIYNKSDLPTSSVFRIFFWSSCWFFNFVCNRCSYISCNSNILVLCKAIIAPPSP